MRGDTVPAARSSHWYEAVKRLPTMLSCTHGSPSPSLPSAARQASFALVPVPEGEGSKALAGQVTGVRGLAPGSSDQLAIGKRLGHDRIVIIMILFEFFAELLGAETRRDGECAEVIGARNFPGDTRGDKICKAMVELRVAFVHLLAQEMEPGQNFRT